MYIVQREILKVVDNWLIISTALATLYSKASPQAKRHKLSFLFTSLTISTTLDFITKYVLLLHPLHWKNVFRNFESMCWSISGFGGLMFNIKWGWWWCVRYFCDTCYMKSWRLFIWISDKTVSKLGQNFPFSSTSSH